MSILHLNPVIVRGKSRLYLINDHRWHICSYIEIPFHQSFTSICIRHTHPRARKIESLNYYSTKKNGGPFESKPLFRFIVFCRRAYFKSIFLLILIIFIF